MQLLEVASIGQRLRTGKVSRAREGAVPRHDLDASRRSEPVGALWPLR